MIRYYIVPRTHRRLRRYQPINFNGGRRLPMDVRSDGEEYVITAEVPGFKAEDIHVEILDDVLTLRAELKQEEVDKEESNGYVLREIKRDSFSRSLRLPTPTDVSRAEARVEDGLLIVRVPKAEDARPKEIKVKAR